MSHFWVDIFIKLQSENLPNSQYIPS